MEVEDALRKYCSTMIVRVRNKRLQTESSDVGKRRRRTGKEWTEAKGVAGDEFRIERERNLLPQERTKPERGQTSPSVTCQGPEVQPVPFQLISMLRLKTFKEDMRRAAEVELHDPTACSMCEREAASLALKSFIRRKKTQLQFQALKCRLNTHLIYGISDFKDRADISNKYFCQHTEQTDYLRDRYTSFFHV